MKTDKKWGILKIKALIMLKNVMQYQKKFENDKRLALKTGDV